MEDTLAGRMGDAPQRPVLLAMPDRRARLNGGVPAPA